MASKLKSDLRNNEELRIVMVGKTGTGKSSTGNTILGHKVFESKFSATSTTIACSKGRGVVDEKQVAVIDTPGLFDTRFDSDKTAKELSKCITRAAPGPHVFLVVIRLGRFTKEEKESVQTLQKIFGEASDRYSMVLFTHGDLLVETTIEEFIAESPDLQELVYRCKGRYHVFSNKNKDRSQVTKLLQKIRNIVQKNGGSHYTNEMFQEAERAIEEEKQRILKEKEEEARREQEKLEKKIQEKYAKEMQKVTEQLQAEMEKERKEREEERKKERKEMSEEMKKQREAMEAEWKQRQEEMKRELNALQERHDRELEEERKRMKNMLDREARGQAEEAEGSLFIPILSELVNGLVKTMTKCVIC